MFLVKVLSLGRLLRSWLKDLVEGLRVINSEFEEHDTFLATRIQPTVFSNGISRQIYKGTLGIQRNTPWQKALAKIDKRSKLLLTDKDTEDWQTASIAIAVLVLNDPFSNSLDALDPTGKDIIKKAVLHRRVLRRNHRS